MRFRGRWAVVSPLDEHFDNAQKMRVSDVIGTQVRTQVINKCRIKIV